MNKFYRLKNGLRVVMVPMAGVESVAVGVYVKTGSRYETEKINGLSHFLEHMVFKGTKNFPTHYDTSYLEGLGAIQNAWTDVDATAYWCKIVADKWRQGLNLMSDLALYPVFPEKDLEIERGVVVEEINRREDRPDEIVSELLVESLFPDNPMQMTVLGKPEVIKTVSRDDFVNYHKQQYVAGRISVVVAGNIKDEPGLVEAIEKIFGGLPEGDGRGFEPVAGLTGGPKAKSYHKKTAEQIHFEMGMRCFDSKDKRRFALAVLTAYLGQGLSSRLFTELREKRGLCYSVNASSTHLEDVGVWSVYAGVAQDKFGAAVTAVWDEMKRLKEIELSDAELTAAQEKIRGQIVFSKENPIHQMEYFARQVMNKPDDMIDYDILIQSLIEVTKEQVREVAKDLFDKSLIRLAVVGDVSPEWAEEVVGGLKA